MNEKILNYWEDDFKNSFGKHLNFLKENLENQEIYSSKFVEILEELDFLERTRKKKMSKISKKMNQIINKAQIQIIMKTKI